MDQFWRRSLGFSSFGCNFKNGFLAGRHPTSDAGFPKEALENEVRTGFRFTAAGKMGQGRPFTPTVDRERSEENSMSRLLFVSLVAFLAIADFPAGPNLRAAELPSDIMLSRYGLQRAWWGHATLDPTRDRIKFLFADEQETFAQSDAGMVTAFDNASGRRLWAVQVGMPEEVQFALATNERLALVVSGTKLYALDKKKGDVFWQVPLPSAPSAGPTIDDKLVYIGAANGALYTFDLKILEGLIKDDLFGKYGYRGTGWRYQTGSRIAFPCVSTGNVVCVASRDGSLYALDVKSHSVRFQFETDKPVSAPIAQHGSQIYFATNDMKFYCMNAETGALKWELLTGLQVREAPRVIGEHLFLRPENHGLYCLMASTGRQVWWNPKAGRLLSATPDLVYASDDFGNVMVLRRSDGQQLGSFALPGFATRISNDRTDRLYFATETGLVVCLREIQRDFPLFHRSPDKLPLLPELAPDGGKGQPEATGNAPANPAGAKTGTTAAKTSPAKADAEDAAPTSEEEPVKPGTTAKKKPAPAKAEPEDQ